MKTTTAIDAPDKVADIIGTLVVLNRGNFVIDAGRELTDVVEAIRTTGKKGSITLSLELTPSGRNRIGVTNQVSITPKITTVTPKHEPGKSLFFLTEDAKLTRDDPEQMSLEME